MLDFRLSPSGKIAVDRRLRNDPEYGVREAGGIVAARKEVGAGPEEIAGPAHPGSDDRHAREPTRRAPSCRVLRIAS